MNMFDLTGKIALVTGGAHSIGFAIGCGLAQAGATICFNCTNEDSMRRGIAHYAAEGITAYGYVADVTSEEEMNALVAKIRQEHGIIDILVNNAGIIKRIPMLDMSVEDFRKVVDVDLNAPFICAKAVLPGMLWQVPNQVGREGNYPETSGSAMVAYFYLKGARLGILDKSYAPVGAKIFQSICDRYLTETDGKLNLGGICLVAGLGPENNRRRDGTYEYYISEPIVENDAKGLAPFLMCYTELLLSEKEDN